MPPPSSPVACRSNALTYVCVCCASVFVGFSANDLIRRLISASVPMPSVVEAEVEEDLRGMDQLQAASSLMYVQCSVSPHLYVSCSCFGTQIRRKVPRTCGGAALPARSGVGAVPTAATSVAPAGPTVFLLLLCCSSLSPTSAASTTNPSAGLRKCTHTATNGVCKRWL